MQQVVVSQRGEEMRTPILVVAATAAVAAPQERRQDDLRVMVVDRLRQRLGFSRGG